MRAVLKDAMRNGQQAHPKELRSKHRRGFALQDEGGETFARNAHNWRCPQWKVELLADASGGTPALSPPKRRVAALRRPAPTRARPEHAIAICAATPAEGVAAAAVRL
jgi:hypothetical protein